MHTGHVRYDQDSEPSNSVKVRDIGTPDPCRNSRPSELPTYVGTPDEPTREQQFYNCWVNTEHVRYDQDREISKSVKYETSELPTIAGTPDRRNSRPTSELPTNQPEINNITIAGQILDTSGINTRHVWYC